MAPTLADVSSLPTYEQLLHFEARHMERRVHYQMDEGTRAAANRVLLTFMASGGVQDRSRSLYLNREMFQRASSAFRKFLLRAATPELARFLKQQDGRLTPPVEEVLYQYFTQYVQQNFSSEVATYRTQVEAMDMRLPHTWYPFARALKRKIIYHAGPTNSGKTYMALQALKGAKCGAYCGPLRLLAMEVYDTLNAGGVLCDLVTGQEVTHIPGATHISCTVEMVPLKRRLDVAVIDEIQLIGDDQRGFAWTRALLGLPANEIHVCGDPSALSLIHQLTQRCGDTMEVRQYERFAPLAVDEDGLPGGLADVQKGDCLVAFTRANLYNLKQEVEALTGLRACIVYGSLPPETRRVQARLFNDASSPFDVLVASDAVGLGLNLNIRRVVFTTMVKKSPHKLVLPRALIRQIAGRAGRRNSEYPNGLATCLHRRDMPTLRAALSESAGATLTQRAGLFPEFETIELLAGQLPGKRFDEVLAMFAAECVLDQGTYFFCNAEQMLIVAKALQKVPGLSLLDCYKFCLAPVSTGHAFGLSALVEFASLYSRGLPVHLPVAAALRRAEVPTTAAQLLTLEAWHKVISLWLWLSHRFDEGVFPGRANAMALSSRLIELVNAGLQRMAPHKLDTDIPLTNAIASASPAATTRRAADGTGQPGGLEPRKGEELGGSGRGLHAAVMPTPRPIEGLRTASLRYVMGAPPDDVLLKSIREFSRPRRTAWGQSRQARLLSLGWAV